jgi:hypothetical protein
MTLGEDAVAAALREIGARYLGRPMDQTLLSQIAQEIEAEIPGAQAVAKVIPGPRDLRAYVDIDGRHYQLDVATDGSAL